jgi:sporulation protein YlmC with PRC-barrel domain
MSVSKNVVVTFSVLAFAGASAYASQPPSFSALDKDKDGLLNRMEAAADPNAKSNFEKFDKNRDEKLNRVEYETAQSASTGSSAKSTQDKQANILRASELIGKDVTNNQGEDLGEIKDIVVDLQNGTAHSAVLDFGGFLGVGEKQYAFPMSQLKPGQANDKLVLNVDKEKLKSAEGFAKHRWPAMNDEYWTRIGKPQGENMKLARASELIGTDVQYKNGEDAGEVKDLLVSLNNGQIRNVVLDVEGAGQARIQPKALSTGTDDKLVINMSPDQLKIQAKNADSVSRGATGSASSGSVK